MLFNLLFGIAEKKMCTVNNFPNKIINTLTDPNSSCLGYLLDTTPLSPRYPWVPGDPGVIPEPRFRSLVLDHQVLTGPEAKFDHE